MPTVIITGAAGNLGEAVVNKFLGEGYHVIGTISKNKPQVEHSQFETATIDLQNEKATEDFVNSTIDAYQKVDAAVLTVGGFAMGKVINSKYSDFESQFKTNFLTTFSIARPLFAHMIKKGQGRIVLISSRPGVDAHFSKGMAAYALSKAMLVSLAAIMNEEARGVDVVVTVIAPSTIDTPANRKAMPSADTSKWVKAPDLASVIYNCCSREWDAVRDPLIKVYGND